VIEACIAPDWAAPARVRALATTRLGGASAGPWRSLNLGAHCGDEPAAVAENRRRLAGGLPAEPLWLTQMHGDRVITHAELRAGDAQADAVIASAPGEVCAVLTADCLPVLLAAADGSQVAAAHAGWRGLAAGVLEHTVRAMAAAPEGILAWLGPAIGPDHYQVGEEVRAAFLRNDPAAAAAFVADGGRWLADLYLLARQRLERAGVGHISGGGWCTACDRDRFYSYRRDGQTGRMATLVWLAEDL
jgi:hypothetical protein